MDWAREYLIKAAALTPIQMQLLRQKMQSYVPAAAAAHAAPAEIAALRSGLTSAPRAHLGPAASPVTANRTYAALEQVPPVPGLPPYRVMSRERIVPEAPVKERAWWQDPRGARETEPKRFGTLASPPLKVKPRLTPEQWMQQVSPSELPELTAKDMLSMPPRWGKPGVTYNPKMASLVASRFLIDSALMRIAS